MTGQTAAIDWGGPRRQCCPSCSRNDRDKTLGVTMNDDGSGVAHCFRCAFVETFRPNRPQAAPAAPARRVIHKPAGGPATLRGHWREFYNRLEAPAGPALAYLQARGCVIPPADGDLRWHPALPHPSGYAGPALVALVTDACTRDPITLHRTWVRADGTKPPEADPPRMLLGGHRKAGGVIRLWPDEAVSTCLAVAEGIETALSLARIHRPAWACIDAGNLATLPVLPGIEALVIGTDHDDAGIRAADACVARWGSAGVDVVAIAPRERRTDWNDWGARA